jgi:hypothetical protein
MHQLPVEKENNQSIRHRPTSKENPDLFFFFSFFCPFLLWVGHEAVAELKFQRERKETG